MRNHTKSTRNLEKRVMVSEDESVQIADFLDHVGEALGFKLSYGETARAAFALLAQHEQQLCEELARAGLKRPRELEDQVELETELAQAMRRAVSSRG